MARDSHAKVKLSSRPEYLIDIKWLNPQTSVELKAKQQRNGSLMLPQLALGNSATARAAERYRCAPMMMWHQGPGYELLRFPLSRSNKRLRSSMAAALQLWTAFDTIEHAASTICEVSPSLPKDEVLATIHELIDCGGLVAQSELLSSRLAADLPSAKEGIGWLAIPTMDRSQLLERALLSYADHFRRCGRRCDILISDDSRTPQVLSECFDALRGPRSVPPVSVWYAGITERIAFAKRLSESGEIPPAIVHFGLCGSPWSQSTTGANRNSILCHTLGSMVLSVDDDTLCRPQVVPGTTDVLRFGQHRTPSEVWCFESSAQALKYGVPTNTDILEAHQRFLGRSIGTIWSEWDRDGNLDEADGMCGHSFASVLSGLGRVRATYNGSCGDSGLHSDVGLIANRSCQSRRRIQELGDDYVKILESRQVVRQVLNPTISHPEAAEVGMFMGLDNTLPLPPFLPVGRNEDGVFAKILGRMSDHHYVAHLPFTLLHAPLESRFYMPKRDVVFRISDLIATLLAQWTPEPGPHDPEKRMISLGRYFSMLGALPAVEFEELANVLMCARCASRISSLEKLLAESRGIGSPWIHDVNRRIEALQRATDDPLFFVPVDLPEPPVETHLRDTQWIVAHFGGLLEWWGVISQRVMHLKDRGITLARCIS